MRRALAAVSIAVWCVTALFAEEAENPAHTPADEPLFTFKLDYFSTYLWRGTYLFNGDGAVVPSASYNILGSGAVITFMGEFAASYFFEGSKRSYNGIAFGNELVDVGIDYEYSILEKVTVGGGWWFSWAFNSAKSSAVRRTNLNYMSATVFVRLDSLPVIPKFTLIYDYYTATRRGGDFYASLTLNREFELSSGVSLELSVNAGYYYMNTARSTRYTGPTLEEIERTPIIKGFSDIATLLAMKYSFGLVELSGGFGYVIVPAKSWYKGSDIHRFYGSFSVSFLL